jgi:hypothetical protein
LNIAKYDDSSLRNYKTCIYFGEKTLLFLKAKRGGVGVLATLIFKHSRFFEYGLNARPSFLSIKGIGERKKCTRSIKPIAQAM